MYSKVTGKFSLAKGNIELLDKELFDGKLRKRLEKSRGSYFNPFPSKNKGKTAKNKNSLLVDTILADSPLLAAGTSNKKSTKGLPKFNLPKIKLPKINLPKWNPPKNTSRKKGRKR